MPCSDITEVFEAHLDFDDRLLGYTLRKRTCGAAIGSVDLLAELFVGKDVATLLAMPHDHVGGFTGDVGDAAFLPVKHFAAMQTVLAAYVGRSGGRPVDPCTIASIAVAPDGVHLTAHVTIDAAVEAIRSCGNCGSCGSHKKSRGSLPVLGS